MSDKKTTEAGIAAMVHDDGLRFDGSKLGLRDYAADEVHAFQKPREGFVPVVEAVIDTLPRVEDRVHAKGVDAVGLAKKLERYRDLTGAAARVEKIAEMVRETRLAVGDEILNDLYRVYRIANAVGRDDKEIHGAFDFMRDWLAIGSRPAKHPAAPTTPGTDR